MLGRHVVGLALFSNHNDNYADSAFLYYLVWLIDKHDVVPFREILETNYPGTYAAYGLITKIWGYSDNDYRKANFFLFSFFIFLSFLFVRKISIIAAITGILYFSEYYFDNSTLALQREYLAMFPIVGALLIADKKTSHTNIQFFTIGFFFAASASIKPALCIGLPLVMFYADKSRLQLLPYWNRLASSWGMASIGFLSGIAICIAWLLATDTLHDFITISTDYLPLYLKLDLQQGSEQAALLHIPEPIELLNILWQPYFESVPILLALVFVALSKDTGNFKKAVLLALLVVAYRLYIFISIKNFDYHAIPSKYFIFTACGLAMSPMPFLVKWPLKLAHIGWLFFIFQLMLGAQGEHTYGDESAAHQHAATKKDLVDFLREHKRPEDTVQPRVQGTYGPIFPAMLEMEIPMAISRFPLNQVFYHHITDPYIIAIKQEYMRALKENQPTFILDDNGFDGYKSVSGEHAFPEYDNFIRDNYHRVYDNLQRAEAPDQFIIYLNNTRRL
jgi:hypothetical protein